MSKNFITGLPSAKQQLQPLGSWPASWHVFDERECHALAAAMACGRPLLITGDPGTGKSQLARAAAAHLGWAFRYLVVTARTEPDDLRWQFDALERLADASSSDPAARARVAERQRYATPGPLWWAIDPAGAANRLAGLHGLSATHDEQAVTARDGSVVLIDEVDKADSDLPNSLLEVLDNRAFVTPWGEAVPSPAPLPEPGQPTAADPGKPARAGHKLLIVITSNNDRELPAPFLRRCVTLNMSLPDEETQATEFLQALRLRCRAHFDAGQVSDGVVDAVIEAVRRHRMQVPVGQGVRPGTSEALDLLRALHDIAPGKPKTQLDWMAKLQLYVLCKQPGLQTGHAAIGAMGELAP